MEPTYEYVKGKGWIACLPNLLKMSCGTLVLLEFRKPELGEVYTWNYKEDAWRQDVEWVNWVQTTRFEHLDPYDGSFPRREVDWIVLTKV